MVVNIEEPFRLYKDDVYRLALSYTKSPQEAEDVCQSVFLKLLEQEHVTPGKEKAWLMQTAANRCRDLLRSGWWRNTAPLEEVQASVLPKDMAVYQAVMGLPPKYRVVVYLRYYEVMTTLEIGKLLHISQTAVTTRLSRAKQMLKQELKEEAV